MLASFRYFCTMSFVPEEKYMRRCLELAARGAGNTAPNPLVGAVLVHHERIIGEGFHAQYGGPHAEVNCFNAVQKEDEHLISDSVLYVSLEPCAHFGKTPPCADLIIRKNVKRVVVGVRDPFDQVNGKGIEKLRAVGLEVVNGFLEEECREMNKRFFCFHEKHRPYIILKWAQTADGFIGSCTERLMITNAATNTLVHKWRSEESAILVGTNTALKDDPQLNNRKWTGPSPLRIVIDKTLKLPNQLRIFSDKQPTVILNEVKNEQAINILYKKIDFANFHQSVIEVLKEMRLLSLFIEGGAYTLQSFIDANMWDEMRIISNQNLFVQEGIKAPSFKHANNTEIFTCGDDRIDIYKHRA